VTEQQPAPTRKAPLPRVIVGALVFVLIAGTALGVALAGGDPAAPKAAFTGAQRTCDPELLGTVIVDGGETLLVETAGKETSGGMDSDALACVLTEIGMPVSQSEQVWATRALDGRQNAAWPSYTATWTYHPDSGLQMIIKAD
jgi:hypothetical protein